MASRLIGPHPRRARLMAILAESPGLGLRQLGCRSGIPLGTLAHHLALLIRSGAVWTTRHGPRLLHFPAPRLDGPTPVRLAVEAHALDDFDRDLIAYLRAAPQVQKRIIERYPDLPRSTVQHRLARLVKWGFLTVREQGRCLRYDVPRAIPGELALGVAS